MKERLTGAIILVALMVLLVPEVLTGPIGSAPRSASVALLAEGAPLRSYTIRLADDASTHATVTEPPTPLEPAPPGGPPADSARLPAPPAAAAGAAAAPQDTLSTAAHEAARAEPAPVMTGHASSLPAGASPASGSAGGWAVQLGSFAKRANAERLARQVRAKGFKVSISQEDSGRRLYRVQVGAAHDRAAAGALASQLQAAGHRGAVVSK